MTDRLKTEYPLNYVCRGYDKIISGTLSDWYSVINVSDLDLHCLKNTSADDILNVYVCYNMHRLSTSIKNNNRPNTSFFFFFFFFGGWGGEGYVYLLFCKIC